jgi:cell division septation protein DedD
MIELNRHIEILLLENECVIVPDFGGFMTHYVAARYDADDQSFIPPLRTLGFNPQLRLNDSVLAQSYVEAYDISYPEAMRKIEEEVKELKDILNEEGSYVMNNLGTLTVNQEGNYAFEPYESGILSPELYGLNSFQFQKLKAGKTEEKAAANQVALPTPHEVAEQQEEEPALVAFEDTNETDNPSDELRIKMSWIRNTVAVAAAIIAFFLMSTPVINSDLGTRTMSHLQNNIIYKLMPKDSNVIPADPVKDTIPTKNVQTSPVSKKEDTTPKQAEESANAKRYCVVVASQVRKSNAEDFVEQLHRQGYPEARIYIYKNVVRVLCGEYDTEAEANSKKQKLNQKPGFEEAWVYKKKAEV